MTVRENLLQWLADQPAWQQDLARRLVTRTHLDASELQHALSMVRAAHGAQTPGIDAAEPHPIAAEDLPDTDPAGAVPKLLGFGNLRGVGLVAVEQALRFAPAGLSVVYGPNAAGKSTYVRGLKRICRAVDCESAILGNVFTPTAGQPPPSAKVEFLVQSERRAQQLDLQDPAHTGLESISVFDARCAELYVDAENAVAYVPSVLRVLTRLAATQDQMRQSIQAEIAQLQAQAPAFSEFAGATAVATRVQGITAKTDVEELRALASLDEQERNRLTELRSLLAARDAKETDASAQLALNDAKQAKALAAKLRDLAGRLEPAAVASLREAARTDGEAKAAVALAAREFSAIPVPGVGGEPWERMWRAAREFAAAHEQAFPPAAGAHCPLCLQQLDDDVAARMAHFQQHVQSTINHQAERAAYALAQALEAIDERHISACRTEFLAGLKSREEQLCAALERYLDAVARRMRDARADPIAAEHMPIGEDTVAQLERWAVRRERDAEALNAASDPKREQELRNELAELAARDALRGRLHEIEGWVATLKRVDALKRAHGVLATNRITTQQRELAEVLVTDSLADALRDELRNLGCQHVPIDLQPHATVGETQVRLRLAGAHGAPRVSEILSEGEQRALSLAFFLAEVGMSGADAGIIVDDPVSSLDDSRREYIAKRLVVEAARRQVIVLTHDVPFLSDLADQAAKAGIELLLQGVWRTGEQVGRVDERPPFATMKLRERVGVLDQEVAQWDKQEPAKSYDEAWRRVCDFYEQMRKSWERAVEERLFRGVVQRLQREVKTKALEDVKITDEHIRTITDGMDRCSMFVHDAPPGAGTTLPARTELAADLAKLGAFEKETRAVR